jgi:uncharacterized protein (TIGR00299 family) protein
MTCAYFDCFAGISGDMLLGALTDLGMPVDFLETELRKLPLNGFCIETAPEQRVGVYGNRIKVLVKEKGAHGRDYKSIRTLIEENLLSDFVKGLTLKIFGKLAEVEARIHNIPLESVHFHELGGIDAIVDIVGAALGIEWHGIETITASEVPIGKGFVTCTHGTLPVPAPATIALLSGVPVYGTNIPYELVTPTGAAILTSVASNFGPMPPMLVDSIGYGVGSHEFESIPNLLRIMVGRIHTRTERDRIAIVETNIDDMNPEIYGFLMERLFADGALDVALTPIIMKKNRPGTMVRAMCHTADRDRIIHRILLETTATGVRYYEADRVTLPREVTEVVTQYGKIRVKRITGSDGRVSITPEYEECRRIALEKGIPIQEVYRTVKLVEGS